MFKNTCKIIILIILFISLINAQENSDIILWRQVNGTWDIISGEKHNYIIDKKVRSYQWGYNELINYNTIITIEPLESYTSIKYNLSFTGPLKENVRYMSTFSIKEDRVFYAFRFTGNSENINKIEFIQSVVKDVEKPKTLKWNYNILEIKHVDYVLNFNTIYNVEIRIAKKKTTLLLNTKTIMSVDIHQCEVDSGRFGFSSLHFKPMIWDINVFNGRKKVFSEDFSKDTVRRIRVHGTIEKKK